MMTAPRIPDFLATLPPTRGRLVADAPLAPFTWFRAGGTAEALLRPADTADLAAFLAGLPHTVPVHVLGACSNLIVRDGGLLGVTIRLTRQLPNTPPPPGSRGWNSCAACRAASAARWR
jgi:UDP-N-acetylmuramate dehydrogenase